MKHLISCNCTGFIFDWMTTTTTTTMMMMIPVFSYRHNLADEVETGVSVHCGLCHAVSDYYGRYTCYSFWLLFDGLFDVIRTNVPWLENTQFLFRRVYIVDFVASVCRMYQRGSHWTDFR